MNLRARTPGTHAQHAAGGLSSRDCVPGRRAPRPSEYDVSCTLGNPRSSRSDGGAPQPTGGGAPAELCLLPELRSGGLGRLKPAISAPPHATNLFVSGCFGGGLGRG